MLPKITELEIDVDTQTSDDLLYAGKSFLFDFEKNEFVKEDGKIVTVEGEESLKVWIEKTIRTARYRFEIYSSQYGCELEDLIGLSLPRAMIESEIKRTITEALTYDDRIEDVQDFVIERGGDWLKVSFTVVTSSGDTLEQEVVTSV